WAGPALATGGWSTSSTVQVKMALPRRVPSEAVTVTLNALCVSGCVTVVKGIVPVISPLVGLMLSPVGRLLALKVSESPSGPLAGAASDPYRPLEGVWAAGLLATGGWSTSSTVQVKGTLLLRVPSEAVTVTLNTRWVAGCVTVVKGIVPVIRPVLGLMLSPGGRLAALKVSGSPSGSFPPMRSDTV